MKTTNLILLSVLLSAITLPVEDADAAFPGLGKNAPPTGGKHGGAGGKHGARPTAPGQMIPGIPGQMGPGMPGQRQLPPRIPPGK